MIHPVKEAPDSPGMRGMLSLMILFVMAAGIAFQFHPERIFRFQADTGRQVANMSIKILRTEKRGAVERNSGAADAAVAIFITIEDVDSGCAGPGLKTICVYVGFALRAHILLGAEAGHLLGQGGAHAQAEVQNQRSRNRLYHESILRKKSQPIQRYRRRRDNNPAGETAIEEMSKWVCVTQDSCPIARLAMMARG